MRQSKGSSNKSNSMGVVTRPGGVSLPNKPTLFFKRALVYGVNVSSEKVDLLTLVENGQCLYCPDFSEGLFTL